MKPRGPLMIEHRLIERMLEIVADRTAEIEKAGEETIFFPDTERYFTAGELDAMLADFHEFDRRMIHEKYRALVDSLTPAR